MMMAMRFGPSHLGIILLLSAQGPAQRREPVPREVTPLPPVAPWSAPGPRMPPFPTEKEEQLQNAIAERFQLIREQKQLPKIKRLRTREMYSLCRSSRVSRKLSRMSGEAAEFSGTKEIFIFDSPSPSDEKQFLDEIASVRTHQGDKPKIDDAQRFAVDVCTIAEKPQPVYRVVVAYRYSAWGTFLDGLPRILLW
jgi:hypothetical protein